MTASGGMKTIRHAIEVLRCFSAAEPLLGVNEISRRTGLHKSMVSRVAASLEAAHLLERDSKSRQLQLGHGLLALAAPLFSKSGFLDVVRPVLQSLSQSTSETASFYIWDGHEAVVVDLAMGSSSISHFAPIGMRNPAHSTASGKALMAFLPETEIEAIISRGLEKYTQNTITDSETLRKQLAEIRATGLAVNDGEFAGDVGAVASVVKKGTDELVGAVALTVPMYRFDAERRKYLADAVMSAANSLSTKLGYVD